MQSTCIHLHLSSRSPRPASPGMERLASAVSDIWAGLREMRRTCHWLSRRGRGRARGYAHWNAISFTSPLHSRRQFGERLEEWKMAPITGLTSADLCNWPPQQRVSLTPCNALTFSRCSCRLRKMQKSFFFLSLSFPLPAPFPRAPLVICNLTGCQ